MSLNQILIAFLSVLSTSLFSQVDAPYYQSFDYKFNFWQLNYENQYVPGTNLLMFDLHRWAPREKHSYFQNYWYISHDGRTVGDSSLLGSRQDLKPQNTIAWNEPERMKFVKLKGRKGKSIKLTTFDNYDNAGGIEDTIRSRTEILVRPEHGEDSEFYYSWSFMIPDNEEHPDDEAVDNIIAQWHEPIDKNWQLKNVQPPFFLIYKNNVHSKNNRRQLGVMYGLRYDNDSDGINEGNYHSFPAIQIEKGKWIDVILRIKWSSNPKEGFLELWINGEKVTHQGQTRFYAANLYTDIHGNSYPNFLKIGQYRQGQKLSQSIYLDEFRIGDTFEDVNTRLTIKSCEKTIDFNSLQKLEVNEVIGAKAYQFYFVNTGKIINSKQQFLKIKRKWFSTDEIQEVKARVGLYNKSNKSEGFGASCFISMENILH